MELEEKRQMLQSLARIAGDADEDVVEDISKIFIFLPKYNDVLLNRYYMVIGSKGSGKTALSRFLVDSYGKIYNSSTKFVSGYRSSIEHVSYNDLEKTYHFMQGRSDLIRDFWIVYLSLRLNIERIYTNADRITEKSYIDSIFLRQHEREAVVSKYLVRIEQLDMFLAKSDKYICLVYDDLDKIGTLYPAMRDAFCSALIAVWSYLSPRLKNIKSKIFLREDLYKISLRTAVDATKIRDRTIYLRWNREDLYKLLLRHMSTIEYLREFVEQNTSIIFSKNEHLGYMPPEKLTDENQNEIIKSLMGEYFGKGSNKSITYVWLVNHIEDANNIVLPRSLLNLISHAARHALENNSDYSLTAKSLLHGLREASRYRCDEVQREYPVVQRMRAIRGEFAPFNKEELEKFLANEKNEDGFGTDGRAIFNELKDLGIFRIRYNGDVAVSDLYKYGFEIG